MFALLAIAWIVCNGARTISRLPETTGISGKRHHAAAFGLVGHEARN